MSSTTLPKPVSAYVGLLASTVGGAADAVRHPMSVTRLPLLAVSSLLMASERYDELAERGEMLLQGVLGHFGGSASGAARRGSGVRATADQVHGRAAAQFADSGDRLEERAGEVITRLQDAAEQASRAGQKVTGGPAGPVGTSARAVATAADRAAERVERAADVVKPTSPEETMAAEVAAPPTTDRGVLDDAPAAGGPNAAESGPLETVGHVAATELEQVAAAATARPDSKTELVAEPAAGPTADPGGVDAPPPAEPPSAPPTPPAPPAPPAVRKAAAKSARKAAKKAAPPAKKAVPAPTASTAAAAPAVPSGHTDGLEVPAPVRAAAGPLREHDELPLPDFDHMTMGSLRGRLRTLDATALVQLLDYEQAHAARLPILTLLQNRLRKVLAD